MRRRCSCGDPPRAAGDDRGNDLLGGRVGFKEQLNRGADEFRFFLSRDAFGAGDFLFQPRGATGDDSFGLLFFHAASRVALCLTTQDIV